MPATYHVPEFVTLGGSQIWGLLREAGNEWMNDKAPRLGASLAYYALLSLAPLLVVAVAVAALAFGRTAAEGQLFWQTRELLGPDGAAAVQALIRNANNLGSGMLASAIGVFTLLFAASSLVVELGDALNTIWHVAPATASSRWGDVKNFLKQRVVSFGIILGTGVLLLISLMASAAISAVEAIVHGRMPIPPGVLRTAEFLLGFSVTTLLFAAIYKIMPAVRLRWSDVFIGACATSLFFNAGKQILGLYLGRESFASTYGAAGSLVAVLVWVYYSAQLFFFGAEFTKVYARRFGSFRNVSTKTLPGW